MASQFLIPLSLLALTSGCLGGFAATYSGFHPGYATYQAAAPALYHAAPATVYHHQAAAPIYTKSYAVPAPFVKTVAPVAAVAPAVAAVARVAPVAAAAVAPAHVVSTYAAPAPAVAAVAPVAVKQVELESSPRYDFSYGVHDSITGDIKSQVESRDGGNVVGSYSVLDADGYKRTVTYTADDVNGFNAVVSREPLAVARAAVAVAPAVAPVVAPVAAAPAASAVLSAPIYYPQQQQLFQHQQFLQPQQQQFLQPEQESEVVEAPQQPEQEPAPIDYNEEQKEEQQQEQQQQQQIYPQDQQFPPYPSASPAPVVDDSDSDVVEARSAPQDASSTTAAPVADSPEDNKEQEKKSA